MNSTLRAAERERELEKIRGKVSRVTKKLPANLARIQLGNAALYPLEQEPDEGTEPAQFPKRMKLEWVDGFALVSGSGRYLGYLDFNSLGPLAGRFTWWKPGHGPRGSSVFYKTLREGIDEESPLAGSTTNDKEWAKVERAEAFLREHWAAE